MQLCHEALGRAEVGALFFFALGMCVFITIFQEASVGRISLLCRQFLRDDHFFIDCIQLRTRTVLPRNSRPELILMEKKNKLLLAGKFKSPESVLY